MKKIIGVLVAVFAILFYAIPAEAKLADDSCTTIQSGTLKDTKGRDITLGYDQWGYNYEAHMFNGWFGNYSRPLVPVSDDDRLMMKWNDAWLSNKDCDGDGYLDRHFESLTYKGSGAWLTNHATGTYESSTLSHWDVSGDWVIAVNNGAYPHDYTFTMTSLADGTFTGVGGYPAGSNYAIDEVVLNGQITGDNISFTAVYYNPISQLPTGYSWTGTGTIDGAGNLVAGTGTSGVYEWHSTSGKATEVMDTCTWSDFVKIVAVPLDAVCSTDLINGVCVGDWILDGAVIGPAIWGDFAIIQEVSSDPCEGFGLEDIKSELRSGLGNW